MDNKINLQTGFVELLDKSFPQSSFDVVHMSNALDHAFDPVYGISEMLSVCRVGGKVILRHSENEAENENYLGFHQWNLSVHNPENSFIIWRANKRFDITKIFNSYADIEIYPDQIEQKSGWKYNKVVLRKKKEFVPFAKGYDEIFSKMVYNKLLHVLLAENDRRNLLGLQNEYSRRMKEELGKYRNCNKDFFECMQGFDLKKVDIYGAGKVGKELYALLMESGIEVGTIIDKYKEHEGLLPVTLLQDYVFDETADAILVTIENAQESVAALKSRAKRIVLLEDLLIKCKSKIKSFCN